MVFGRMKPHTKKRVKDINQRLILNYLATNPNSLIRPISKKFDKDYSNIHSAFGSLVKHGLIEEGGLVKSKKNVETPSYRLTEKGVMWVWANGDDNAALRVADYYEEDLPSFGVFRQLVSQLDDDKISLEIVRIVGKESIVSEIPLDFERVIQSAALSLIKRLTREQIKKLQESVKRITALDNVIKDGADRLHAFAYGEEESKNEGVKP